MIDSTESTTYEQLDKQPSPQKTTRSRTLVNGLIGGLVSVFLAFVPFSTVLGGAIAGYLERGDYSDGVKVGTIAGIVSTMPVILIGLSIVYLPIIPPTPLARPEFVLIGSILGGLYVIGLNTLGGVLGTYLHDNIAN